MELDVITVFELELALILFDGAGFFPVRYDFLKIDHPTTAPHYH